MPERVSGMRLYSTVGCHLCERAQRIVLECLGQLAVEVDIADDEALMARYATRIPVLARLDTRAELAWPFGADDLRAFLGA